MTLPAGYLEEFPPTDGYLNFASIGPPSLAAERALTETFSGVVRPGGVIADPLFERLEHARERAATLVGVSTDHLGLVHSTSEGLFSVAFGLGEGGNVVVPAGEFPANLYPWIRAAGRGGPEVRMVEVPDGRTTAEALAPHVDDQTVAIALSLVCFLSGFRVDLAEMRELAGERLLIVDAIQGVGAIETALEPADVMVAGGQKWLRAGNGVAFLAMSDRALDRLDSSLVGWTGVDDFMASEQPAPHRPLATAGRFQLGSAPIVMAAPFGAALDVLLKGGPGAVEAVVLERSKALEEVLRSADAEVLSPWRSDSERSGIVSFKLPGIPPQAIFEAFAAGGVVVSIRNRDWIRLSPHATTPAWVVDHVADLLAKLKVSH